MIIGDLYYVETGRNYCGKDSYEHQRGFFVLGRRRGGPRSSIITKLRSEGHNVIYFGAPINSQKVQNIRQNQNASICYYSGSDSITLLGRVEFVTDNTLRKQLWREWCQKTNAIALNEYDFCPMKFTTTEATFWIRNKLSTFNYE